MEIARKLINYLVPGQETTSSAKRKTVFVSIALIAGLGFLVYANSLNGKFVWDDDFLVKNNVYLKNWAHLPKIFTEDDGTGGGTKYNFYRPLRIVTYMIDYHLWKLDVRGYHFINIVLHIGVACCIYWLITLLFGDWLLALLAGAFFVIHPVHTEAVAYISGRTDPLSGLFILLCFIFYIKCSRLKSAKVYSLILISYVLALLSKESALILPALLLLYHFAFKVKIKFKNFLSVVSIAFIYIVLRLTVLVSSLPYSWNFTTVLQRTPGFFVAVTNYIRILLLPINLRAVYGDNLFNFTEPKAIIGCVILFLLLIYAFKRKMHNQLIFFSVFWFFIGLLPVCGIYPLAFYMAEHYIYLPSIGFFLIVAQVIIYIYRVKKFKTFTTFFVSGLLVSYSCLTIRQNNYWREPIAFYKRTLRYVPRDYRMHNNLGKAYSAIGKQAEAIASFNKTLEINPGYVRAYNNLGNAYNAMGKKEQAIALYNKAIEINPEYAEVYYNLANIYYSMG
ncbi:MAG: tetratricopeptide repeat protein, partial [Candidatus Omnitrophota bacterium]